LTVPPGSRRRKRRLVRAGGPRDDLILVIRATPANRSVAVEEMVDQAILCSERYVIDGGDAGRQLLYGLSVLAHRDGQDLTDVLYRFPAAPMS
jgi:hypothetical protein